MKLSFKKQKMMLAHLNVRSEVHGEDREPAGDIKLEGDVSNEELLHFHPALKSLLYYHDEGRPRDLVGQAEGVEAGYAPDLRMPNLVPPLKFSDEMMGASVSIRVPGEKLAVELAPVKVNAFAIEPREGGTISLSMRIQANPSDKEFGRLAVLVQTEVEVDLTPGDDHTE